MTVANESGIDLARSDLSWMNPVGKTFETDERGRYEIIESVPMRNMRSFAAILHQAFMFYSGKRRTPATGLFS